MKFENNNAHASNKFGSIIVCYAAGDVIQSSSIKNWDPRVPVHIGQNFSNRVWIKLGYGHTDQTLG